MNFEVLITVSVSMILGILGFVVNTIMQRKSNSIKVITQYRVDRKNATHEITSKLLAYTDYHFYESLDDDEKKKNVQNIVIEISRLRSIYYFSFPKDIELVAAAYNVKKLFCVDNKNWDEINHARAEYAHLADVYTSTDWKRIKLETVGKDKRNKKALPAWTEIFTTNDSYFSPQANTDIFIEDFKD